MTLLMFKHPLRLTLSATALAVIGIQLRNYASFNSARLAMPALKALTVAPTTKHTSTVIFVHGLGDSGHGWEDLAEQFSADSGLSHVKWVLPHAPVMSVTANGGARMPSWFDIKAFGSSIAADEDEVGMIKSVQSLDELVEEEVKAGIDTSRIVFGGFSQGAAMTLLSGLTGSRKYAGLAVLSGRLPLQHKIQSMLAPHAKTIPIFWAHGTADPMIPFAATRKSVDVLVELGLSTVSPDGAAASDDLKAGIQFHSYQGMGHSASPKEVEDLRAFLKKVLTK